MASIAMMAGGAIVNALAFSGSNYLFSKLDKKDRGDTLEERKRHDDAVEQMQAARDASHAVQNFHDAEAAWREYILGPSTFVVSASKSA